jgi:hypothetical protein
MKILNLTLHANWIEFDIACKLNWIWIVHWNSIQFRLIELYLNLIELYSNSIEKKWNENWWKSCWKFACEYCVGKKTLKRHKSKNMQFHASLLGNGLNKFEFGTTQVMTITYGT